MGPKRIASSRDLAKARSKRAALARGHLITRFIPVDHGLVARCRKCGQQFVIHSGEGFATNLYDPCPKIS